MARLCPACERPNGDQATSCLYCTEPLPLSEAAPAPEALADASAREPETPIATDAHLVILLPQSGDLEARIGPFAQLVGSDSYDARLTLLTRRPRLFRKQEDEAAARQLSEALSALEIAHYVVSEAEVRGLPVVSARGGQLLERHLELDVGRERERESVAYRDLLLVVRGDIVRERHTERRISSLKGASRSLSPGMRFHLYSRNARLGLEIEPDEFDWSLLEQHQTSSALWNSQRFIERLLELAPDLAVDRGFDHEPVVLSRAETKPAVEAMLGAEERSPEGTLYDNEPQFHFYSRWRFRLERHLDQSRRHSSQ